MYSLKSIDTPAAEGLSQVQTWSEVQVEQIVRDERNQILPAPYWFALVDVQRRQLVYLSEGVGQLFGLQIGSFSGRPEFLLCDAILGDELPVYNRLIANDGHEFWLQDFRHLSGRVFITEYRARTLSGDILRIMHQNEAATFTSDRLPGIVIVRFVDITWLSGDEHLRTVKKYEYNRNENVVERFAEVSLPGSTPIVLTPREREVAELVNQGHTSAQIARSLGLSIETVKTHRKNINAKRADD